MAEDSITIREFDPHDMPLSCTWIIIGPPSSGKCGRGWNEVTMYDGRIKQFKDVKVGDLLMGDDSTPRRVKKLYRGRDKFYKFEAVDGSCEPYYFTGGHTLALKYNQGISVKKSGPSYKVHYQEEVIDTSKGYPLVVTKNRCESFHTRDPEAKEKADAMAESLKADRKTSPMWEIEVDDYMKLAKSRKHHLLAYRTGVEWEEKDVKIDPYFLGLWLGDGTASNTEITSIDPEIIDYVREYAERLGMRMTSKNDGYHYSVVGDGKKGNNFLLNILRSYNLTNNKHIPHDYKVNSRAIRLQLLAGLIDTDGYLANNSYYEITQKNKTLADDIVFVARSLGFYVSKTECTKGCMHDGSYREGIYQRMNICSTPQAHISEIPVLLHRKVISPKPGDADYKAARINMLHYRFTITEDVEDEYYGIEVDGNHRFLLGDFTVTRNCLGSGTKVMKSDGGLTEVQTIKIGDELMGDDLKPRRVKDLGNGRATLYEICYDPEAVKRAKVKAKNYIVNGEHILCLKRLVIPRISVGTDGKTTLKYSKDENTHVSQIFESVLEAHNHLRTLKEWEDYTPYLYAEVTVQDYLEISGEYLSSLGYGGYIRKFPKGKPKIHDLETPPIPITIKKLEEDEYFGFTLENSDGTSSNGRFLLEDGTVTHNTTFMENMAYHLKHRYPVARVFIGTEENYKHFCKVFHPLYVSGYWDDDEERSHIKRQKTCVLENGKNYPGNYAVNIIDDISDDPKAYKSSTIRGLFKLGSQHWAQLLMIGLQYAIDMPTDVRKCVSYVALGREPEKKERLKLYENFGGLAGSFEMFNHLMDKITGDYTFLIFKKRSQSNNLEDCLFWYRTKKLGRWKFGCKEYREWADKRYDTNYVEEIEY